MISKKTTVLLLVTALTYAFVPWSESSGNPIVVEKIAAVVDGRIILLSEVNARVRPYMDKIMKIENPEAREQAKRRIQNEQLQGLIEEKLILTEANRRKIRVSETEVNQAVKSVMQENNITYEELKEALEAQGYPMEEYRRNLKNQIMRLQVLNMAVRSRISVSEDDARAFYQKQTRALGVDMKLTVSLILISLPITPVERRAVIKKTYEKIHVLRRQVEKNPESFASLAKKHSHHPSSSKGGFAGEVGPGDLSPALEKAVFTTDVEKGQIVGPVETEEGIYLVKIEDKEESETLPFDQVKDRLKNQIFQQRLEAETRQWLDQLRRKAYVDIKL